MSDDVFVQPSQSLWAVYHDPRESHAEYLNIEVDWSTQDPSIARVDASGVITPIRSGATWVTAKYSGYTAIARVNVTGTLRKFHLIQGGRLRSYVVYVPDNITMPAPLVIGFHGGGGNAYQFITQSQINRIADAKGFIAVYPEGTSGLLGLQTWNGGNCCGKAQENGIDDVGFVRTIVKSINERYYVDSRRIYATGLSNGAMMTHRLACEASDLIAAVAVVSGGMNTGQDFPACLPTRAVPIMMFHGTSDLNYPIEGGDGSGVHGVPDSFYPVVHPTDSDTLGDWQAINDTRTHGTYYYRYKSAQCTRYDGVAPVVMCIIDPAEPVSENDVVYDGGGHSWPGGVRAPRSQADTPSYDIDASEQMWRFLRNYTL
jgi:polyhydroxybutyrate depolymerase